MAKLDITQRDKVMLSNIPKLIKMGKFELTGDEVIAASQIFSYIGELLNRIDSSLAEKPKEEEKAQSPKKPRRKVKAKVENE